MTEKNNVISYEEIELQKEYMARVRAENESFVLQNGYRRKAFVLTLGCQQNEADSEKLSGMAEERGYEIVDIPDEASLIIVNTCAIREHAEQRALSLVGQYKHIKAINPDLKIVICGCMVVQEHRIQDIKLKYPYVDILFGTSSLHLFPSLLNEKMEKGKRIFYRDETEYKVAEGLPIRRENKFKAWVSIMYGCNNFCSYCIVPYVRGRERSRLPKDVISEVRELVNEGYKDITLLGQNVNSYGKEFEDSYDFADLLSEIDKIDGDNLFHFMTSHPKDASHKLIDVMSQSKHIARHFHLPIQAGSDRVLKVMNRHYDLKKYLGIADYIREKMPDCVITSDFIVGFPSETEEEFEMTLDALKRVKLDMIISFIYSARKGTPAAEMEEQISPAEKSRRMDMLLKTQNEISLAKNKLMEGMTVRVLCEGLSKNNDNVYGGRTQGGKLVFFDGEPSDTGKFVSIKIERADTFALYGTKIN